MLKSFVGERKIYRYELVLRWWERLQIHGLKPMEMRVERKIINRKMCKGLFRRAGFVEIKSHIFGSYHSTMEIKVKEEGKYKFIEEGEGQPLLVLHGLFGALSNFRELIVEFSKKYRVIVPMMPLYDMPLLQTGVKSLSEFIIGFMEHKNLKDVILLGNSLGGHVGLVTAKNKPEWMKALVLTGSSGLYENAFGGSFPRREDKDYIRKKIAVTFYDPEMVTDELVDVTFNLVQDRTKLIKVLALAKSAIRNNMRNDLENYKMPVCLIWGKNDTITPPDVAEEFLEGMPDAELFWIDKCGHAPMMEHPQEFNDILSAWLDKRF